MIAFWIVLGVVILLIVIFASMYNKLVTWRNRYKNAYAQIDVQLKRRYDLIPNLVEVAKGYLKHERETLEAVIAARNVAFNASQRAMGNPGDPAAMKELGAAEGALAGTLSRLMMVAEAYPDLKANQNFLMLQEELSGIESKIAYARQFYNDSVMTYNTSQQTFPSNLVAGMFGHTPRDYFEIEEAAKEPVKVQF